jgi:glycerol kinase
VGERAPTWPEGQAGVIEGLTQATTAGEVARAAATAAFYRLGQILERTEHSLGRMRRIIVSGGILRSAASVRLLADALGRDLEISREREASLRGAAVYALRQLGMRVPKLRPGKMIKHDRRLAALHRKRRDRQVQLERQLTKDPF